ncbi:MAG: head-tail connector protein [Holosporales bacterium]|nr:head-tail connector protein [Holosporales bacterium]
MLKVIKSSSATIISPSHLKQHLRIDHSEDDARIDLLLSAATELVERDIGQTLLTKVWHKVDVAHPTYSGRGRVSLQYPPISKIISVNECLGDKLRPLRRYVLELERVIPSVLLECPHNKVEIVYQAGWSDDPQDIPPPIRQAILMLAANMYEKQDLAPILCAGVDELLHPYRIRNMV